LLYFLLLCSHCLRLMGSPEKGRSSTSRSSQEERATLIVSADGSYRALTPQGASTEGKFYLQDGKLRYRSSRATGTASLSEDRGKTMLTVMPEDPKYHTGRAEYERVKE